MVSTENRTLRFALGLCCNLTRWFSVGSVHNPTAPGVEGQSQQQPKRARTALAAPLPIGTSAKGSLAVPAVPTLWLALTTSLWPVLSEVSLSLHTAMHLPPASQTFLLWGEAFGFGFFFPFNEWQHSPAILTRMWVHTLEGSMRAQSLLCAVELPVHPEPALLCSQLSLLSKGTHKQSCTHRDAQGTRTLEQSQRANQAHNKTHPREVTDSSFTLQRKLMRQM